MNETKLRRLVEEWREKAKAVQSANVGPEIKSMVVDILWQHAAQVEQCLK